MDQIDCIVIGAGVIGLATARALAQAGREVLVLDAGPVIGSETSSRNSEVIHAGIYYPVGSLKAKFCVTGRSRLYDFCRERGVRHARVGKLIVATEQSEVRTLEKYMSTANANGVHDLVWLTAGQASGLEPAVRCVRALHSPSTGIIDSHEYMLALQADIEAARGSIVLNTRVTAVRREAGGYLIEADGAPALRAACCVNAAGLSASSVAASIDGLEARHVPGARYAIGHYFTLTGRSPFNRLVYPVAERAGLGIHVTLDLAGQARFGPDVKWIDGIDYRFDESRRAAFAVAIRRYYPDLDESRLQPAYTGIRPKITGPDEPAADFIIQGPAAHGLPGLLNFFGIESPGLTASLAIADAAVAALQTGQT
ncbi:MAG: NAD(P)/FAD-dependent oxidoreductase [Gammaproteobacteria bacterium]|nr:NAD(P)/FAD-dependent oxidoreductase [Gammaproteobacteria bacterium]